MSSAVFPLYAWIFRGQHATVRLAISVIGVAVRLITIRVTVMLLKLVAVMLFTISCSEAIYN